MSRFIIVLRREKPGLHPRRPGFFVGSFYPCTLVIVGALVLYLAAPKCLGFQPEQAPPECQMH